MKIKNFFNNNSLAKKRILYIAKRLLLACASLFACIFLISIIACTIFDQQREIDIIYFLKQDAKDNAALPKEELSIYLENAEKYYRSYFGLDKSVIQRSFNRCFDLIRLDLGYSMFTVTSSPEHSYLISDIIKEQLPNSLILFTSSTVLSLFVALYLGTKMASRPGGSLDKSLTMTAMVTNGLPSWLLGHLFVMLFAYMIPIFRVGRLHTPGIKAGTLMFVFDYISYMLLPFITLCIVKITSFSYIVRSMVTDPLQEDYIFAARGRGIKEKTILFKHALRVTAPSILTVSAQAIAQSIAGDVIVERLMARPGLGFTLFDALVGGDMNLIIGILVTLAIIYCVVYALLDISYAMLDPRIS